MKSIFKGLLTLIKILATVTIVYVSVILLFAFLMLFVMGEFLYAFSLILIPGLIPLFWLERKKKYVISYCSVLLALFIAFFVKSGIEAYEERITIDVTPNINVSEYLPFDENSKIVKFDSRTLKLTENLPIIDGAAAVFPVYSAFVNAVYPSTTVLHGGAFEYNNTVLGYQLLAEQKTDVFLGAMPSEEQIKYAKACGTTFEYTEIGTDAFVFFVHKDNPIDSLTTEQIKGIYSGEITNWREVGGYDEEIVAFQRNEGSGSQSMMLRFMGDTPIIEAELKKIFGMGEIVKEVVDYQSKSGSIGFSFRYYIEGIIKNPDIKMISVDGAAPTVENIKNRNYPIVAPLYAVTYAENTNENVDRLIEWMLSDEGQYIIEKTGYSGVNK